MRKLFAFLIFSFSAGSLFAASYPEKLESDHQVDFRLFYPFVKMEPGIKIRQRNYLGLDLNYQVFFSDYFGYVISPGAYFIPIRINTNSLGFAPRKKLLYYMVYLNTGIAVRAVPHSWPDPTFMFTGGAAANGAGKSVKPDFAAPVQGRFYVNIYANRRRFMDPSLALTASTTAGYHVSAVKFREAFYWDVGLSIKGSF